jgi:5-methylcytosine-specific restriction endonuclease McrBC regulatory subunit McrC
VTQAFVVCSARFDLVASAQEPNTLSETNSTHKITIRPDVVVRNEAKILAIIDAKYKKLSGVLQNHDLYQMISYGTALQCLSTYLFYPSTECDFEGCVYIKNSSIRIDIRGLNIEQKDCVAVVEGVANQVLKEQSTEPGVKQTRSVA